MKKQRRLKLEVNKVSISKLNNIKGGVDPVGSVILCALTEEATCACTEELVCTISQNVDDTVCVPPSVTGITIINQTADRRC